MVARKRKAPAQDVDDHDAASAEGKVTFEVENASAMDTRDSVGSPVKTEKMTPEEAKEKLAGMLEEFDAEVEGRCDRMRVFLRALVLSVKKDFAVELIRLPKTVRTTPIEELFADPTSTAASQVAAIAHKLGNAVDSPLRDISNATVEPATASKRRRIARQNDAVPATAEPATRRSARTTAVAPTPAGPKRTATAVEATPMRATAVPQQFTILQTPLAPNGGTVAFTPRVAAVRQTPATARRGRRGEPEEPVEAAPVLTIPLAEGGAIEVDAAQGQVYVPRELSKQAIKESIMNTQKMLESLLAQMA